MLFILNLKLYFMSINTVMHRARINSAIKADKEKISNPWLSLPSGWRIIPSSIYLHVFDELGNYQGTIGRGNPKAGLELRELLELV